MAANGNIIAGQALPILRYAHLVGWGKALPERVLSNHDLEAIVETDDEWIRTRTGIVERRIAGENESTTQLAFMAAQRALEVANVLPTDVDLIVVATSTPEHIFPSTASLVQDQLGASHAGAYDLSAACSGFVYALDMAASKIRTGDIEIAVVIGAETMSRVLDWTDRGTCILFGDGAGAVVLQGRNEPGGILASELRSDGAGWDMLGVPTVGSRDTYLRDHAPLLTRMSLGITSGISPEPEDEVEERALHRLHMNGREVYRFATRVVAESIRSVLHSIDLSPEDVKLIIPHQANQRIIEAIAKKLELPIERVFSNVAKYGNTSAASIPIALCEAIEEQPPQPGDKLVLTGFGGGLTWASMVIEWSDLALWEDESYNPRFMSLRRRFIYWYALQRRNYLRFTRRVRQWLGLPPRTRRHVKTLRRRLSRGKLDVKPYRDYDDD